MVVITGLRLPARKSATTRRLASAVRTAKTAMTPWWTSISAAAATIAASTRLGPRAQARRSQGSATTHRPTCSGIRNTA